MSLLRRNAPLSNSLAYVSMMSKLAYISMASFGQNVFLARQKNDDFRQKKNLTSLGQKIMTSFGQKNKNEQTCLYGADLSLCLYDEAMPRRPKMKQNDKIWLVLTKQMTTRRLRCDA